MRSVIDAFFKTQKGLKMDMASLKANTTRWRRFKRGFRKEWQLYTFLILPVAYYVIFKYIPTVGNIIAFRRYQVGGSLLGEYWVGFRYFSNFINDPGFWKAFSNTLRLSFSYLITRFPATIIFALLINEIQHSRRKRVIQTISYLPHFISVVVVAGMVQELVEMNGPINLLLQAIGGEPIHFLAKPEWFTTIYVSAGLWQNIGWGTILYLAAMTNLNPELYEAAKIDGAGRMQQAVYVTLPGILPTIVTLLVLDIGRIMNASFDRVFLLYNPLIYETADIISTYVYRIGLSTGNFSYSTAIGLFEAVAGSILIVTANYVSRRLMKESLW
jgi:putative aldouronate transport system permease protein